MNDKDKAKMQDPKKLRNLLQYKDMSDEKFAQAMEALGHDWFQQELLEQSDTFDERVSEKMKQFEVDYDLSDMKYNDRETLIVLCKALVTSEDYEFILVRLRSGKLGDLKMNLTTIEKLSKIMTDLRRDISRMQDDLKITRKIRKSTGEESARALLDKLKKQAAKFYEKKMQYVYCKKCMQLLTTTWFLFPESDNSISLKCRRRYYDDNGVITHYCDHVTKVSSKELLEKRGNNHPKGFDF